MRTPTTEPATEADGVLVAIDGSAADLPVLAWAAEEADRIQRPLLITHGAGHLPRELTYAERPAVRKQRVDEGRRITDQAADWVRSQVPALRVDTVVRLLRPTMLLPAVGGRARLLAQSGEPWWGLARSEVAGPVLAALSAPADAHVLRDATGYAGRRGLDVIVLEGDGPELARRIVERSKSASMVFLSRPRPDLQPRAECWSVALDALARSLSPVVLVAGDTAPRSTQ